jgi:hypothetical protein
MASWKRFDVIRDALPADDVARLDAEDTTANSATKGQET